MGNIFSKEKLIYPDISRNVPPKGFDLENKEVRKQLIDMAVEQFASLLFQQVSFQRKSFSKKNKPRIT